jgi:orotidine-5'-phosphate decarboxylase
MNNRLIVALDFSDASKALAFTRRLRPDFCRLKIGSELFVASGPQLVQRLMDQGFKIFLDLKFHDIPNTVAAAVSSVSRLGVWMVNIHASGGRAMMQAANQAIALTEAPPRLIAVTTLTSLDNNDLKEVGISAAAFDQTQRLAALAKSAGLDGVVCSGHEAAALRQALGDKFLLVTPGIRLADDNTDDQKRIMTPVQAIKAGADYLVIGRSITRADDPVATICAINAQIEPIVSTT